MMLLEQWGNKLLMNKYSWLVGNIHLGLEKKCWVPNDASCGLLLEPIFSIGTHDHGSTMLPIILCSSKIPSNRLTMAFGDPTLRHLRVQKFNKRKYQWKISNK